MKDFWRLTIEKDNGQCVSVCGIEETLRSEFDAWVAFENTSAEEYSDCDAQGEVYKNYRQYHVRTVHGFTDTADRSDAIIAYRFVDVIGMALVKMR